VRCTLTIAKPASANGCHFDLIFEALSPCYLMILFCGMGELGEQKEGRKLRGVTG
jgi:hypothetical protein